MEKMKNRYKSGKEDFMEESKAKQVITLKNLPSNLVEEAIVVLKSNKKTKNLEYMKKNLKEKEISEKQEDFYILKEAEMIMTDYLNKLESKEYNIFSNRSKLEKKYLRLKNINIGLTFLLILSLILHLI